MSRFQLEQDLALAVRMDTSIHLGPKTSHASRQSRSGSNSNSSLRGMSSSSKMVLPTLSNSLNRSQSESRLNPNLSRQSKSRSASPSRSKTPTRGNSNSMLDLSGVGATSAKMKSTTPCRGDRFIPNRSSSNMEVLQYSMKTQSTDELQNSNENLSSAANAACADRREKMSEFLCGTSNLNNTRILAYSNKAPVADESHANDLKVLYSTGKTKAPTGPKTRHVAKKAEKVLDAPDLVDDFYLHLIDWSSHNHLAVALSTNLFVWNANDGSIEEVPLNRESDDDIICCVKWVNQGNVLAVSSPNGDVELFDTTQMKLLRRMSAHSDRVASLSWNEHILASGCRDGKVNLYDVRVPQFHSATLSGHNQEVCGMAWSTNKKFLATGANDNLVLIWDHRNTSEPLFTLNQHLSAVKAMSWCPWQANTLATGGGSSDRSIKFWNLTSGECMRSVDAGSQVSSLLWNSEYREIVSGHGFSQNQLTLWNYPKMTKVADLQGHTSRILEVVVSPDQTSVASAAADETIRIWKIWPHMNKKAVKSIEPKAKQSVLSKQRIIR